MPRYIKHLAVLIIFIAAVFTVANAQSESEEAGHPLVENLAIVLLIDISGSMSYTDPGRLRETAAALFIDLLSPEDYISVITFDHDTEIVVPLQAAGDAGNKSLIKGRMSDRLDPRGYTDYTAALQAACAQLDHVEAERLRPVVVFLTDGEPNPDSRYGSDPAHRESYMESMWEAVNRFTVSSRPIYTIAFSDEVDPAVIERISLLTRGRQYLLDSPRELLVSFYDLLETLKNRQRIVEKSAVLEEHPRGFSFTVDRQVNQVNLIIESLEGSAFTVSVNPPRGVDVEEGNPFIGRGPGYCLVVFHEPAETMQGEWEAVVSGRGAFRVLGNADQAVKAWFIEPAAGVVHALGEPVDLKVLITGLEVDLELPLALDMQIGKPEQAWPEPVSLTAAGGYHSGSFSGTDLPGIYEISLTVLLGGEPVARASSTFHVKILPRLSADFRLKELYRTGEELELRASLFRGGHRLTAGGELVVDHFNFVLSYNDGSRITVPLTAGEDSEQGEGGLSEEFWSNRITLDRAGDAGAVLMAAGRYRGENFLLEQNLGRVTVRHPGEIVLQFDGPRLFAAPGRTLLVPVTAENRSSLEETLFVLAAEDGPFSIREPGFVLAPGETGHLTVGVAVDPSVRAGPGLLELSFEVRDSSTAVQPLSTGLAVEILSPAGYYWRRLWAPGAWSAALKALLLCGFLFFGGGLLFYLFLARPREKLGKLLYERVGPGAGQPAGEETLPLYRARGKKAVVSFKPAAECDFVLAGGNYAHDLVFETRRRDRRPLFLLGWQALLGGRLSVEKVVSCTPPGVIEVDGAVYTRRGLYHGFEFKSGDYLFKYRESPGNTPVQNESGVNLLEGKT